jgi:4-diphosphocytidyl-2-C-methyl-D-erythritol kinase
MSGSGATCFGLYGDEAGARQAALILREELAGWWVVATRLRDDTTGLEAESD